MVGFLVAVVWGLAFLALLCLDVVLFPHFSLSVKISLPFIHWHTGSPGIYTLSQWWDSGVVSTLLSML